MILNVVARQRHRSRRCVFYTKMEEKSTKNLFLKEYNLVLYIPLNIHYY